MKVNVRQISIVSKPECTFYLKIEWTKDLGAGFVVLLCDGAAAWSGEVSEEDITREAQEMEMPRERYINDLQLALTGDGQAAQCYSFHLAPLQAGSPMFRLSYEKNQCDMSFRFGMVDLLHVPEPTKIIKELIAYGLERCANLQAKKQHLHKENQRLRNIQEHMTAEMERYVQEKESLERDLYSRFVLVLNSKKAKLCDLQRRNEKLEKEKQRGKSLARSNHGKCEQSDERPNEESDYGSTTDEEGKVDPQPYVLKPDDEVLSNNPMDDSLNDVADVAPSRKRRQRHLQRHLESQPKRQTLEKSQTSRSDLSENSKAEVRKAPIHQPVSVSPDPDQLFDDF